MVEEVAWFIICLVTTIIRYYYKSLKDEEELEYYLILYVVNCVYTKYQHSLFKVEICFYRGCFLLSVAYIEMQNELNIFIPARIIHVTIPIDTKVFEQCDHETYSMYSMYR